MARRESFDFYPTPAWATEILLRHLPLDVGEDVLEPCAGDGDIADVVLRYRPKPVSDAAKDRRKRAKRVAKKAKADG